MNRVKARTDSLLDVLIKKVQVRTCDVPHDVDTQLTLHKHNNVLFAFKATLHPAVMLD